MSILTSPAASLGTSPAPATNVPLPRANPEVIYRALPDGAVLFCPSTESYFGLNRTGAFVWEHLAPTCRTVADLCTALREQHPQVEQSQLERDVVGMLGLLAENELVARD